MKYCSKCGTEVHDDAFVCPNCGCKLDDTQKGPVGQLSTTRSLAKFILLSLITFGIYGIVVMSVSYTHLTLPTT